MTDKRTNPLKKRSKRIATPPEAEHYETTVDREGCIPLSAKFVRENKVAVGDEFASWMKGENVMVVFPKSYRGKMKIPKDADWGKVKGPLREKKKRKAAKVKTPTAQRAKHAGEMS